MGTEVFQYTLLRLVPDIARGECIDGEEAFAMVLAELRRRQRRRSWWSTKVPRRKAPDHRVGNGGRRH